MPPKPFLGEIEIPVPNVGATMGWSAEGRRGNRSLSHNGGYIPTSQAMAARFGMPAVPTSLGSGGTPAPESPYVPSTALGDLGKTSIRIAPPRTSSLFDPTSAETKAPQRTPGFTEGLAGGLVDTFTGILPDWMQEPLVKVAGGIGTVADVIVEGALHVPLPWQPDTPQAFEMLPESEEKSAVRNRMAGLDPTEQHWWMTSYIRSHGGDLAKEMGLPTLLAPLIQPDATIIERMLAGLGVGAQAVARGVTGALTSDEQIRALAAESGAKEGIHPEQLNIFKRYNEGKFGTPGSKESTDRLRDELIIGGFSYTDDPFMNMMLEMVLDPVILAGFVTGGAKALRGGSLLRKASEVNRIARASTNPMLRAAFHEATSIEEAAALLRRGGAGPSTEYRIGQRLMNDPRPEIQQIVQQADQALLSQGRRGRRDYVMTRPGVSNFIEGAAKVSDVLNSPFGFFGRDGIGKVVGRAFRIKQTQGALNGFEIGKVYDLFKATPGPLQANLQRALGTALANSERALQSSTLTKILRVGKGETAQYMPDNVSPDQVAQSFRDIDNPFAGVQMEEFIRRVKQQFAPPPGMDTAAYWTRQREIAAEKWAKATGMDIDSARKVFANADDDMLAFADYVHFGKLIDDFTAAKKADIEAMRGGVEGGITAARTAARKQATAAREAAETALDEVSKINRVTLVGPRELTMSRAQDLLSAIAKGDVNAAKAAVSQFDLLHQNFWSRMTDVTDEVFLQNLEAFLTDVIAKKSLVQTLQIADLPPNLQALMQDVLDRLGDKNYEVGLAPSRDRIWRTVTDKQGKQVGYVGWMDIDTSPTSVNAPTRFDVLRQQVLGATRAETLAIEARRKFIQDAHKWGVDDVAARTLFDALRTEASRQELTIRGLNEATFRAIWDEADIPADLKTRFGPRELMIMAVRSLEGDLRHVGLTSKATAKMKAKTAGVGSKGNWVGFIAENIYPAVRFHFNPMFWIQEWIEPLFFNILRGIKPGIRYTPDQVKRMSDLLDHFDLGTGLSNGIEMRASLGAGAYHTHIGANPRTGIAKLTGRLHPTITGVNDIKQMNAHRMTKERLGVYFHDAMEQIAPGQWAEIRAVLNQLDLNAGGKGHLDNGELAMRYMAQKGFFDPDNPHTTMHLYDGAVPKGMGRIEGIRKAYLARAIKGPNGESFDSGADLRRAIQAGELDEWDVRSQMAYMGYDPDYISRAWTVMRSVDVNELLDDVERGYAQFLPAEEAKLARDTFAALLEQNAVRKGIDLEEYVATKFADNTRWLDQAARLPYRAYTQLTDRLMEEAGWPVLKNGHPKVEATRKAAQGMWPDTPHDKASAHGVASKNAKEGKAKIAAARVKKSIRIGRFRLEPTVTTERWKEITLLGMDEESIIGAGGWYRDMVPKFTSYVEMMDIDTLRGLAETMNSKMKSMKPITTLDDVDALRAEVAARMLMAWGASQIQQSPRAGFSFILRSIDQMSRGLREGVGTYGGYIDAQRPVMRLLNDFERNLTSRGMGPKLHDFVDSLLGNTGPRSYMRFNRLADDYFDGDGALRVKQAGAMDVWMGREMGFVDSGLISHVARKLARERGLAYSIGDYDSPAMIAAQIELGTFHRRKIENPNNPEKDIPEPTEEYRARKLKFEQEHGVELDEAWSGSPSNGEYEWMLQRYNEIADDLNRGDGWLGRSAKNNPWTVADIQAVAWIRIQKALDIDPGGPLNMFSQNGAQVAFEIVPGKHAPLSDAIPMHRATPDAKDIITGDVATALADIVRKRTGVTIVRVIPGMGGWTNTVGEHSISPNTFWEVIGSEGQISDAIDTISYLTQQDVVLATRQQRPGVAGTVSTTSSDATRWSLDFEPLIPADQSSAMTLDGLRTYLDTNGVPWQGSMNGTRDTGGAVVRSLYGDLARGTDLAGFEAAVKIPDAVAAALADGSWAVKAKVSKKPIPVAVHRDLLAVIERKNNWKTDRARAEKRRRKGEAPDVAYREEMGKKILDGLRKKGRDRGEIARQLVDRDMAALTAVWDDSLKRADPDAWATGRGERHLLDYYPDTPGGDIYEQRSPRGWRGATAWNQRREATLYLNQRADITTVVHENFHLFAEELDPSGVEAIHRAWSGATGQPMPADHGRLVRGAEEWAAHHFEKYAAEGFQTANMPSDVLAIFNAYGDWGRRTAAITGQVHPELQAIFDGMTPEYHRGPMATFDVNQFRFMEAARIALQRAEEESFKTHYYKRGRTWLERSVNHPYLGMYPASYMWGKVLPELMRFLIKKPFGVDAPLAGLAMANHVWEAIQIEMSSESDFAEWVKAHPESLRFLQLLVPGTPWDIPVNAPAWMRRISQDAWAGKEPDVAAALQDTISYSFGAGRGPFDIMAFMGDIGNAAGEAVQMAQGTYKTPKEREEEEKQQEAMVEAGMMAPPETKQPTLVPGMGLGL